MTETFKVYFQTRQHFPRGSMGVFPKKDLSTHILLFEVKYPPNQTIAQRLERIYEAFQGFNWARTIQSKKLIDEKHLGHTSMCPGDLIEHNGDFYLVGFVGFHKIQESEWS